MYIVIHPFRDLQDKSKEYPNGKIYAVGDIFLNEDASQERLEELSSNKNKIGRPLIKLIKDKAVEEIKEENKEIDIEEYATGHGWYEYEGKKYRKDDLIKVLEGD